MPKAFSDEEKQRIRERLLKVGRECFTRYGLKKTTVEDLTRPVGIAKSSFYLFFESKEALYIELMFEEMPGMIDRLMAASFEATDDVREAIVHFQVALVREIETNELARILIEDPQGALQLAKGLNPEAMIARAMVMFERMLKAVRKAQGAGKIIDGDPQEIVQMLGIIKVLPMYRDKINPQQYPRLVELMSQVIADGLTCPARRQKEDR